MDYLKTLSDAKANRSVIPEGCLSFSEEAVYLSEFAEAEFTNMIKNIGINELAVFESTGVMPVYEGAELETLQEAVKKFHVGNWAANKSFWEHVMKKFESKKKGAQKLASVNAKDIDGLAKDTFGKIHTFSKHDSNVFGNNGIKLIKQAENTFNALAKKGADAKEIKAAKVKFEAGICKAISGKDVANIGAMRKALAADFLGNELIVDKSAAKKYFGAMKDVVVGGKTLDDIKKCYNEEKKVYNAILQLADKTSDANSSVVTALQSVVKSIAETVHACYAVEVDVYGKRFGEYRNVLVKLYSGKKAVKEAALDPMIESLFDF